MNADELDDYKYKMNVCGALADDSKGDSGDGVFKASCDAGSGVCQYKKGTEDAWSLGKPQSPQWDPEADGVYIEYTDGTPCEGVTDENGDTVSRTTRINFECGTHTGFPVYQHETGCYYVFNWRTSAACPTTTDVIEGGAESCVVTDSVTQVEYDLTKLGDKGVLVADDPSDDWEYHLSLCGSKESAGQRIHLGCPPGTAICQVNKKDENFTNVVGKYPGSMTIANGIGKISMQYERGDMCQQAGKDPVPRSAVVTFECSESAIDPVAEFKKEVHREGFDGCQYLINIKTHLACSGEDGNDRNPPCEVADGDHVYDLTPLQGADVTVLDRTFSGVDIKIDVCTREDKNGPKMEEEHGGPHAHIEYEAKEGDFGAECEDKNPTVHIDFYCPEWAKGNEMAFSLGSPEIREKTKECQFNIDWYTTAGCPLRVKGGESCKVVDRDVRTVDPREKGDPPPPNPAKKWLLESRRPPGTGAGTPTS